jgi:PAS domain S-box
MELDIKTLSFALLLTFFIQTLAFLLMMITTKRYKGVSFWALGELFIALGFGSIFLRSIDSPNESFLVLVSNSFQFVGLLFVYIGTKLFYDHIEKNYWMPMVFVVFLFIIGYYTYIENRVTIRIIVFSATMIPLLLLNARVMLRYPKASFRKSSKLVATIFIANALAFVLRILFYLVKPEDQTHFFDTSFMQAGTLLLSICIGLLWTFGLILIVNQRLNGELAESVDLFTLIFNSMPDAITISDIKSFQLYKVNPSFSNLTRCDEKEVLSNPFFVKKLLTKKSDYKNLINKLQKTGHYTNQEITLKRKDGSDIVCLLSSAPIRIEDKDCLLTIGRDITELKQKEKELDNKTNELKIMVAEMDKFFSILAHDLRGPLATVVNLTELMMDTNNDLSKEELVKLAIALNKSANSTNELLENLLEWSGVHRGIKTFKPVNIYFSELMETALVSLTDIANTKNIVLQNEIPGNAPIHADVHMAQAIFRNLIINAIKFTNNGGSIRLSAEQRGNEPCIFSITDTGIGMDKETLDTLFHINFKNNRPGTNGEPSSGLGLLLCKEFIDRHQGQIWVKSEVSKGSTFSFCLGPVNIQKTSNAMAAQASASESAL